jgi:hypothetical protein
MSGLSCRTGEPGSQFMAVDDPRYWDDFMNFPILVLMDCARD